MYLRSKHQENGRFSRDCPNQPFTPAKVPDKALRL